MRRQFYSDVLNFGGWPDAAAQVAAGYMCLAGAIGWVISFVAVLALNPRHIEAHVLAVIGAAACFHGFLEIRRRRDPRIVLGWLIHVFLLSVAIIVLHHSGILAPIMASLPAAAGIAALYLRGRARRTAFGLGVLVVLLGALSAFGVIGLPTTYTEENRAVMMMLSNALSIIALGGLAWVANLSRDFAVERLAEANALLAESQTRSSIALEAAKVGLWDVPDIALRKFHVSDSFRGVTGYSAEEFDRAFGALDAFVHPDDVAQLREAFAFARKRMSRLRADFRLKTRTRGYRWFSVRAKYSANPDGSVRLSGSLQDINFIKAAEEALRAGRDRAREANKAKSSFIAMMSHEVRTPLNAILGSVEVLKRGRHDRETSELLALIDDAGRGLMRMVNDLLDVSKIEAGKLDVAPAPADVCELLTRTVEVWRAKAANKGLTLTIDCSQAQAPLLLLDAGRVRQIVSNLVSNAIKFTNEGEISATASTRELPDGRIELTISVVDSGPGVPDTAAESIFAPFEQGPQSASRGGTGLGLFISRRLARLMGGDLVLESARRKGAHFRLYLVASPATDARDASAEFQNEDPFWTGKRVLCVDDNDRNLRIVELLLQKFGIEVQTCASGAETIDLCAMETYDLILMDIVMPDMDGFETLRHLRNDGASKNRTTPVIALTAKLSAEDISAYAEAGFDGFAGKPINVPELAQAIAPFMVERASEDV